MNSMPAADQGHNLQSQIDGLTTIANKVTHSCGYRQTHHANIYEIFKLDFASLTTIELCLPGIRSCKWHEGPEEKGKVMKR